MKIDWIDYACVTLIGVYTLVSPFTKVEESFNLQAVHDLIYHGRDLASYDHFQFPGVVPRTFVGAIVLALIVKPYELFASPESKFDLQLIVRGVLGLVNGYGLVMIRHTVEETCNKNQKGRKLGYWFMLFQCIQFHVIYYASRTLPNMFVFPLTNFAICQVLNGNYAGAVSLLAFSSVVFRAELVVFTGALAFCLMVSKRLTLPQIIRSGLKGTLYGGALSFAVDSYFWQKSPMIPEVVGFMFNVVQGNSEQWGIEPFHSYLTVHLPNMITNPIVLGIVPVGIFLDPSGHDALRILGSAATLYVGIHSLQPHKEWRFIVYIMPILSLLAANGMIFSLDRQKRALIYKVLPTLVVVTSIASFGISLAKLGISASNYPGGQALQEFHKIVQPVENPLTVHLDVPACMTGVSRFGEINANITYDKTEDPQQLGQVWQTFDYLITSHSSPDVFPSVDGYKWDQVYSVNGFQSLNGDLINQQLVGLKEDPAKYFDDLVWRVRRTHGLKGDFLELWDSLVLQKPQIFIYKKSQA